MGLVAFTISLLPRHAHNEDNNVGYVISVASDLSINYFQTNRRQSRHALHTLQETKAKRHDIFIKHWKNTCKF